MMIVTFNCDWKIPEEECAAVDVERGLQGVSAVIGTGWRPVCPANENLPHWLEVYG